MSLVSDSRGSGQTLEWLGAVGLVVALAIGMQLVGNRARLRIAGDDAPGTTLDGALATTDRQPTRLLLEPPIQEPWEQVEQSAPEHESERKASPAEGQPDTCNDFVGFTGGAYRAFLENESGGQIVGDLFGLTDDELRRRISENAGETLEGFVQGASRFAPVAIAAAPRILGDAKNAVLASNANDVMRATGDALRFLVLDPLETGARMARHGWSGGATLVAAAQGRDCRTFGRTLRNGVNNTPELALALAQLSPGTAGAKRAASTRVIGLATAATSGKRALSLLEHMAQRRTTVTKALREATGSIARHASGGAAQSAAHGVTRVMTTAATNPMTLSLATPIAVNALARPLFGKMANSAVTHVESWIAEGRSAVTRGLQNGMQATRTVAREGSGVFHHEARRSSFGAHDLAADVLRDGTGPGFFAIGALRMKKAARRWPNVFNERGGIEIPTSHAPLLRTYALRGEDDLLLSRLNAHAAFVIERIRRRGDIMPISPGPFRYDRDLARHHTEFDLFLERELGQHVRDELKANDIDQFRKFMLGLEPTLERRIPTEHELNAWADRTEWVVAGRRLRELPDGQEFVEAVTEAQNRERLHALERISSEPNAFRQERLWDEYIEQSDRALQRAAKLGDIEQAASTARTAFRRTADDLARSPSYSTSVERTRNRVDVLTFDGTRWTAQARDTELFPRRALAQIADAELGHLQGRRFLTLLDAVDFRRIAVYGRHVPDSDMLIERRRPYRAWHHDGTIFIFEEGAPLPRNVTIPDDAVRMNGYFTDEDSIFKFLSVVYEFRLPTP